MPQPIDRARLRSGLAAALRARRHPESRIRVTFAPPALFASVEAFEPLPESLYDSGAWCVTVPLRRERPQAKDTRFLPSAQEAYRDLPSGAHEGLLVAEDGSLLEGLSSNVFAVLDGVLRTEDARVLRGTTRSLVLELARGLVPVSLVAIPRAELGRATEVFLTSVSREVLGVARVDDVTIGRGRPGPLARELRRRYRARMRTAAEHLLKSRARLSRSHLRPLAVSLPHPDDERERDALAELPRQELADVLDARELEHVVPVAMVVFVEHLARARLQVVEVHHHPPAALSLDHHLDLVGVAVHLAALRVAGQEMRAVDELGDAEAHEARLLRIQLMVKASCRAAARGVA